MSMENFPKKEIVVISATAIASGIGAVALYIFKYRRENKTIFIEDNEEVAKLFGVPLAHSGNKYIDELNPERYDGEPIKPNEEEQAE